MNWYAVRAIYRFEMARTLRTVTQSIAAPVISTSLYFVVFGAAIGSRMGDIDGISYGAFMIPGLIMRSLLNESTSNAAFGIYMPKWSGTIYELLSAPVSLEFLRRGRCQCRHQRGGDSGLPGPVPGRGVVDFPQRLEAEGLTLAPCAFAPISS